MNCVTWRMCDRISKKLISNRIVFASSIHHITNFGPQNNVNVCYVYNSKIRRICPSPINSVTINYRKYAKKKKPTEQYDEEESESEDDDIELDEDNIISRSVPSLRVDSVLKAGLGISKKRIEKEFYDSNIRLNGESVTKKSSTLQINDELDLVNGPSPENPNLLSVNRVILKSIGKPTGSFMYPVKLQVFKSLSIENYTKAWVPVKDSLV